MALRKFFWAAALISSLGAWACTFHGGGLGSEEVVTDDGGQAGVGGDVVGIGGSGGNDTIIPPPGTTGGTGGSVTASDAGLPPDPGPGTGGMTGTGGRTGTGGSPGTGGMVAVDASVPPPKPDAQVPPRPMPDAAIVDARPPVPGTIDCGATRCNVDSQVCCLSATGAPACIAKDALCPTGALRRCGGPQDCDGERVCCARADVVGSFRSACLKDNECTAAGGSPMCRTLLDCAGMYKSCTATNFTGTVLNICLR